MQVLHSVQKPHVQHRDDATRVQFLHWRAKLMCICFEDAAACNTMDVECFQQGMHHAAAIASNIVRWTI